MTPRDRAALAAYIAAQPYPEQQRILARLSAQVERIERMHIVNGPRSEPASEPSPDGLEAWERRALRP